MYSRTDLRGNITYANRAFAEISGFLPEEMEGQPHNMIRHPDMPPDAFRDMWASLKAGKPWKGLVKNRRKDGGFYWVVANASPVREGGTVVGYQSVRSRPTREQIVAADKAYRRLREGDKSLRIRNGRVVRNHSRAIELALSHEARLYAFVLLALVAQIVGVASGKFNDQGWLHTTHMTIAVLTLCAAIYMAVLHLPHALRRLKRIDAFLEETLSSGNLTRALEPGQHDIIGNIAARLDTQIAATRATLQVVGDATREVSETTASINGSIEALVSSATRQNSTTSSAAAAVEEMAVSIEEVAAHAVGTREAASESGARAREGARLSALATETINALSTTVSRSAETVEKLGDRTTEIGSVALVIKEIATQTNLLALNAAIEAARAGEQGRGFAVVADEVRKLAERTAQATEEIDGMIGRIHADTAEAVSSMRQSATQVSDSVSLVHEAHESLQSINGHMENTLQMVSEISHSAAEQGSAMAEVARGVEEAARLSDQNLGIANDTEGASHVLQSNVARMQRAVAQYRV
ncbi:methyl-accepting chemotaxis protein [Uliginosibacterium sp. sgz301328]|uniref:methyl-accepting chemotaxis protein n=1 Tax=Uliginosibacterium sp. sgz301328 TaxID=3243764 RepID=UPI00359EF5F7